MRTPILTQLLERARAMIEDPERWTTHNYAKDRFGRGVLEYSGLACQWCAKGALNRACYDLQNDSIEFVEASGRAHRALDQAAQTLFEKDSIITVNDQLGHMSVLEAYNHAIESSEASHANG